MTRRTNVQHGQDRPRDIGWGGPWPPIALIIIGIAAMVVVLL